MPGQWETKISPWPSNVQFGFEFQAIHLIHLYTGKLLAMGHVDNQALIWNPADGSWELQTGAPARLFCCGHCQLADGRILFAGGDYEYYNPPGGPAPKHAWIYDPSVIADQNPWTQCPDMTFRRYYPTLTLLPDGRALVMSGRATNVSDPSDEVRIPELFTPTNWPGPAPPGSSGTWQTLPNLNRQNAMYSFLHVLPNGRLFLGGPWKSPGSKHIDISNSNPANWFWVDDVEMPDGGNYVAGLTEGSAVMYRPGKIIKAGGDFTQDGSVGAVNVDLTPSTPPTVWSIAASLNSSRRNLNLVALPNGKVLCVGGNGYGASYGDPTGNYNPLARLVPEIWDPDNPSATNWLSLGAAMTDPRYYHSTAMLLQDARVMTAGGEKDGPPGNPPPSPPYTVWSAQIYRPPYLDGSPQRTTITSAPSTIAYGSVNYTVQYAPASADIEIAKGCLIRLGAVTHSYDMDQRCMPLTPQMTTQTPGVVTFSLNLTRNIAPPGYYMFFIMQQIGSELLPCTLARYVRIG